ncbi:AraC family transcriptional regulator [Dyadobacter fanqingshengii]|uniref:DNA-binding transcriptional regulator n=1 Tax=Dyadobacter fanqingshengii TaxID=2906443 RepID=A0A9X1P8Z6_9BACT|nr:DNA-binding transcriptional regulator [Dyadobacter fanqingshengii]MCF0038835.1 DNA-binding transcriptional regulator [Dyadobacter fanqingshengii]MCF2503622.1 DNA-binding transcriptional regulator [Dyadobacter fanqingshengii]USJ34338.1 DNA-binding transcriptional regulator [Dyadobacter fanqingshengii]
MYKIILLLDFAEEYSKSLMKGINAYSKEFGPWIFCRMPLFHRETVGIDGILKWALEWKADGIVGQLYNKDIEKIVQAGIPVIAQDFKERFTEIPNITGGYQEAGQLGADYFLKKGFTNFAFYGFNDIVWSRERAEGYEERLIKRGHKVHYFEHKKARSTELWYYKPSSLSRWLKSLPKPIGLMTCDDNQGQHITEVCRQLGIRIPEEVAVLGVDNDEMICDLSDPPLSSIALDAEKGGYDAAKLLDHMVKHGTSNYYDIIVKPVQVITRHSTDIYATNDDHIASSLKYIHQNIDKNLHVDEVVKQVPLSRRALEKRFLEITGYPIYKYIFNLRIEKFTQKLLDTDMSVFEIALDMGLTDSKNIARQFRQAKGCSPSVYRNRYVAGK